MERPNPRRTLPWRVLLPTAAGTTFGLSVCRALSETFPQPLAWLASWPGTLAITAGMLVLTLWLHSRDTRFETAAFIPLFLPLGYLFSPQIDLVQAYTLLLGSVALFALFRLETNSGANWWPPVLLAAGTLGVYLATLGRTVGQADTFEFQVVAHKLGIVHPTGYPLYLLLGKLFSLLPAGSMAFRINLLSAVCATGTTLLIYATLQRLTGRRSAISLLGALTFAFSPTLWSQAVEAEVYALHSFWVALISWSLIKLLHPAPKTNPGRLVPALGLFLGLSLANHLTTVILFPAVALTLLFTQPHLPWKRWLTAILLFLTGIAFYLYLPLRWPAVHDGAAMPLATFVDWVIGGRFKGALQLNAWLNDSTRYGVIGRLLLDQWGWPGLVLAAGGLLALLRQQWQIALVTLAIWLGYAFYGLNYYVPDISVFIIPAHLIMVLWMGYGVWSLTKVIEHRTEAKLVRLLLVVLFALLPLSLIPQHWEAVDRSTPNPLEEWGRTVLNWDLKVGAAILADSEKIAPLYYLQQTENLRPDLEIMVLPNEAAYRAELDARLAAGQTVYLARFLPRLEGIYHLRSAGPLVEVSTSPLLDQPALDYTLNHNFSTVTLLGFNAPSMTAAYPHPLQLTLYWTTAAPVNGIYQVWLRLQGLEGQWESVGRHPANSYPTSAWRPGEIVPDYHRLELPTNLPAGEYQLQVALRVPFGDTALLPTEQENPWLTIGTITLQEPAAPPQALLQRRIWAPNGVLTGIDLPHSARPQAKLPTLLVSQGDLGKVQVGWNRAESFILNSPTSVAGLELLSPAQNGEQTLYLWGDEPLRCGWLQASTDRCPLASIAIQGAPLPAGATNFSDLIALLEVGLDDYALTPGGTLELDLHWQALAPIDEDYTVFLHVLDPADRIVGQIDSWPVQGTYPTSQWPLGQPIQDHYRIPIAADAAPGAYRLEVGWYLLGSMQRLNVLDADGHPVENRLLQEGLFIP